MSSSGATRTRIAVVSAHETDLIARLEALPHALLVAGHTLDHPEIFVTQVQRLRSIDRCPADRQTVHPAPTNLRGNAEMPVRP